MPTPSRPTATKVATKIANTYYWKGHEPAGLPAPLGIDASMQHWAAHNGCDPRYVEQRVAPHVHRRTWRHCRASRTTSGGSLEIREFRVVSTCSRLPKS